MSLNFDETECISTYMRRVTDFNLQLKKANYNNILNFLNEIFNSKLKTITHFKNINKDFIDDNLDHCLNVLTKHQNLVNKIYNFDKKLDNNDSKYVIYCIENILKLHGYKLKRKNYNKQQFFYIIHN